MKVTNYMLAKWTKAVFEIIVGLVLLTYVGKVLEEFQTNFESLVGGDFYWFFTMLSALFWIVIFWCFVSAAINFFAGFREQRLSLDDIGAKIDSLDLRLFGPRSVVEIPSRAEQPAVVPSPPVKPRVAVAREPEPVEEEEEPPPPEK